MSAEPPRETPLSHALALAGSLANADLVVADTGVIEARWGTPDLPAALPVVKSVLRIADASRDGQFSSHPLVNVHGLRSLCALPIQRQANSTVLGTLWLGAKAVGAFNDLRAVESLVCVIAGLLEPPTNEEQLQRWVSMLPTPAIGVLQDTIIANTGACALTGFTPREIPNLQQWYAQLFGDEAGSIQALYEADRAQGFLDSRTVPIRRKDGAERLIEFNCTTVADYELWLLSDVTERVASQERFRLLFEQSSTAHVLFDESGVIDCNPAAVALLAYRAKSDLLHQHLRQLSPENQPDGERSETKGRRMEEIAFEAGSNRFDWVHRRADGSHLQVEVTMTPLTLGPRRVLLAEWHDITERVRYEEGLEQARDSALQFARAKADFLATMSHEIRTPMNGVIGMTRLLLDTPLSGMQRDYVETVRACGEGLLALINDILDFSRLDAGKVALERINFSVYDLVEDALSVVAGTAQHKGLELVAFMGNGVPRRVWGDPTRVRQVLLNLLSNAVKFTAKGGVTLRIESTKADEQGRRVLAVSVTDTGPGIAKEALPRLFTAFSQEDTSTTRRYGGSGLGLAICKRLVSLMGGIIDVSTSPHGTEFTLSLAFDEAEGEEPVPRLAGRSVLIVDPQATSARTMAHLVSWTGATVHTANDPDSARALAHASDFVLVDHTMHAFGAELIAAGRRVGLITPMVGATMPVAFTFTLPKPVRRRQLFSLLETALMPSGVTAAPVATNNARQFPGVRVLVAEDNVVNQRVIRGLLARFGCDVTIAENGQLALDALAAGRYDLVLMDCQMPELDGLEATRRLRALEDTRPRTPVVALTAGVMEGDRERCLEAGMDDFLAKPVRVEDLERTLKTWSSGNQRAA